MLPILNKRTTLAISLLAAAGTSQATLLHQVPGDWIDYWAGVSVAGVGDVDRDGFDDFLCGVPGGSANNRTYAGEAMLISGRTGRRLFTAYGLAAGDNFGHGVGAAGDVDRDGVPDFLVGAPSGFPSGGLFDGYAILFSGRTFAPIHTWRGRTGDTLGYASSGAGDYDRDGVPDILLGSSGATVRGMGHSGSVEVRSGRTGALIQRFNGEVGGDMFGGSVADVGDVDADGFTDIGVGGLLTNGSGSADSGSAWVFSGRTFAQLHRFNGSENAMWLGAAIRGAGDMDRDGHADIAVGAPGATGNGVAGAGSVFVFSGRTGGVLWRFDGPSIGAALGRGLAGAGDVNHDGWPDLCAGAMFADLPGRAKAGLCLLWSGRDGSVLGRWEGPNAGENMGWSIARAGDVNGDGVTDLVFGAPGLAPDPRFMRGEIYVHSWQPLSLRSPRHLLGAVAGGTVPMFLAGPPSVAGHVYLVLTSITGHAPGVWLGGGLHLPLNPDPMTVVGLSSLNQAPFAAFTGVLDASGRAVCVFGQTGSLPPALAGTNFTFTWLSLGPGGGISATSCANFVGIDP